MTKQLRKIVSKYLEDMDGNRIHPHTPDDVGEARLYFDAGSMIDDIEKILRKDHPDIEILTIRG